MPVQIPTAPILIPLPAHGLRKQWGMDQTLEPLHPRGRASESSRFPALDWPSSDSGSPLGTEQQLEDLSFCL